MNDEPTATLVTNNWEPEAPVLMVDYYQPIARQAGLSRTDVGLSLLSATDGLPVGSYYEGRRAAGLVVEKKNSIFAKGGYTDKEAERNILANPFKRFEDMQMLRHTKTLGVVQVDDAVWKKLTKEEKAEMERICDQKLSL